MSDKCEWKDGKRKFCDDSIVFKPDTVDRYCRFCGADIRKPEPEKPLIVKSGGTWVAYFEGDDYLYMLHPSWTVKNIYEDFEIWRDHWKPFSEITLDDEIAKLRPMVKQLAFCPPHPEGTIRKLWGVVGNYCLTTTNDHFNQLAIIVNNLSLATPKELQELSK